jgi:hypothetical protein
VRLKYTILDGRELWGKGWLDSTAKAHCRAIILLMGNGFAYDLMY